MLIQVNFGDMQSSPALAEYVKDHVEHALRAVRRRVSRVEVYLRDDSSPKRSGTFDKRCVMEARLKNDKPFVVEHRENDHYTAVAQTADKLGRAIRRKIERRDPDRRGAQGGRGNPRRAARREMVAA